MKKIMMLLAGFLLATPFVFAQEISNTGMDTQLNIDHRTREFIQEELENQYPIKLGDARDYIRGLEDAVNNAIDGSIPKGARYHILRNIAEQELKKDPKDADPALQLFGRLTEIFQWLLNGEDLSNINLSMKKEFYNAVNNSTVTAAARTYLLPTIAMWDAHSYDGFMPYRHQEYSFWDIPEQVAKMYNAMAAINHEDAKLFIKEYITEDFYAAYPTFPEEDIENPNAFKERLDSFFNAFYKEGKFAREDAIEISCFIGKMVIQKMQEENEDLRQQIKQVESEIEYIQGKHPHKVAPKTGHRRDEPVL